MTTKTGLHPKTEESPLNLSQVVTDIYQRRSARGLPVFCDVEAFADKLQQLAVKYTQSRLIAQQAKERRNRYDAIAKAIHRLQVALKDLHPDETQELSKQQDACFIDYLALLPEEEQYDISYDYLVDGEHFRPRLIEDMQKWGDFNWLQSAAEVLSRSNNRGRKINTAERETALLFVVLCHKSGWSPIQVANSGTEKIPSAKREQSDAVLCLAAVFATSGVPLALAYSQAHTALRHMRNSCQYVQWEPYSHSGDYGGEDVTYIVSLKKMINENNIGLYSLPDFRKKARTDQP